MEQHRPSFSNPINNRLPPPFFPPPNPHHNHHQHHLPPPPILPPPPPHLPHQSPISFPPPPPPPPPNSFHHHPGHSPRQFVDTPHRGRHQQPLDPNLINHHRNHNYNLNNRPLDFQNIPRRVPERLVAVDRRGNRPFPTYRGRDPDSGGPAVWDPPPRVLNDANPPPPPITRRITRACFDREHPPYRPTFQPVDRCRNDHNGGSRVRKDGNSDIWSRVDKLPRERRDDFSRNDKIHDDRFQRDVNRDIRRKEFVSAKVEHFSGLATQEKLIMQGRGDVMDVNLMWENLSRGAPRSPTKVRNRAIDGCNGFYEKGKNLVLESERYGDRDRWEDAQDYNLTPRKKQKKNVLLRIEPAEPSFRNSYERSPSLCKNRESSQFPDHRLSKLRERSPIVSFKSNLLSVASSGSGSGDGADEVVSLDSDDKNWNELGNKDDLLFPSSVVEKVSSNTDSDHHCENAPCTLKKEEIHLENNSTLPTNLKKLKPSVSHDQPVGNYEAQSHNTECLSEDKKASKSPNDKVIDKSYVASGSGKECSPSFRKKRKITNPHTSLSSSQVLRKDLESMMFDEELKDSGKDLTAAVKVTESTEIALIEPHIKSTAVGSSKADDGKCTDDSVPAGVSVSKKKRRRIRKPRPSSSGQLSGKPDDIQVDIIAYSDALPCDAEVPAHSIQVAPISSVEVGLSVSEFDSQLDLAQHRKGLDLNCCNDASAQISAGLILPEETCDKGGSNIVLPGTLNVSGIPDEKQGSNLLESASLLQGDVTLLMTGAINGYCGFGIENGDRTSIYNKTAAGDCISQNQFSDHEPLVRDVEFDINNPGEGDLSSHSEHLTLSTQLTSDDRVINSSPMTDNLSIVNHPKIFPAATRLDMFDIPNINGNPDGKLCSAQRRSSEKSTMEVGLLSSISNSTPNRIVNSKISSPTDGIANSSAKILPFIQPLQSSKEVLQSSSNLKKKHTQIKNELSLASSNALSSYSPLLPSSGRRPTTVIKSRTWHRTDSPAPNPPRQNFSTRFVPEQKQNVSQTVRAQSNSYVRKGNSLLRNPATAVSMAPKTSAPATSVSQLNPSASDDVKNTSCEIPEKLSSPCNIDSLNCNLAPVGDSRCSPVADSSMDTENGPQGCPKDMLKSPGNCDFEMTKILEDQGSLNHSNQAASVTRRMVYIKHKSNQLVAAPNSSSEISASNKDIPALMSDVYFKSKKNQLVRATPETHSRQTSADPVEEGRRVYKSYVSRSATRRDPNRVSQKIPKSRKFSFVWKLCNTRSPKKGVNSLRCQQVLPHLLPWKRATYQRSLFRTSADLFKNSSLSHKLLSSRKAHIIYKLSGFSLRRSKVVSLAGSSLKWSISLEKRSKKVDKEANLAVAALEKGKRDKSSVSIISSGIVSQTNSLHEGHSQRRLRNDEYVRIGNGNQLIRNPKRRTRILANEKVRWSLHTARMRLAKKRKYCQFFTRFGKCNKEEGKCPYIHDPSKTAVCTKFLNGSCSDPKCKLTHKVIPERMPDCSFFLHGLCSNESCPYRHVSVNPKAAICESFLKGYCAEGNECRKKHSYMCPIYEATGKCPEGSKCKLYHKKGKDKKRKNTKVQKNARGRYFGSRPATNNSEPETECRKRLEPKDDGIVVRDGALADFISLDVSDNEEEEREQEDELANQETNLSFGEQLSLVVDDDPDELIKPIRLLRIMSQTAEGTA